MKFRAPPPALCADSAPHVRRDSDVAGLDGPVSGRSLGEALDRQVSGVQDLDLFPAGLQVDGAPHDVFMNHDLGVSAGPFAVWHRRDPAERDRGLGRFFRGLRDGLRRAGLFWRQNKRLGNDFELGLVGGLGDMCGLR